MRFTLSPIALLFSVMTLLFAMLAQGAPVDEDTQHLQARGNCVSGRSCNELYLLRWHVGTAREHWGLFIAGKDGSNVGTLVHAIGKYEGRPLIAQQRPEDLARFMSTGDMKKNLLGEVYQGAQAVKIMENVALTQPPPTENCVDYTKLAVQALENHRLVGAQTMAAMKNLYVKNEAQVRRMTGATLTAPS